MDVKEFYSILRSLIPAKVKDFAKLEEGEPYHFDGWHDVTALAPLACIIRSARGALAS